MTSFLLTKSEKLKVTLTDPDGLERFKTLASTLKALFNDKDETDPRPSLLTQLGQATDISIATTLLLVWKPKDELVIDNFVVLTQSLERYLQFCEKIDSPYLEIKMDENQENFDVYSTQHVETPTVEDFNEEMENLSKENDDVQSDDLKQTLTDHRETLVKEAQPMESPKQSQDLGWTLHGKETDVLASMPAVEEVAEI